jgi:4-hydroxy-2-oxoheptanedioate aldolase
MNPLKSAWQAGQQTLGVWCTLPGSMHAEMIARQGVDYVCVDYQHGIIDHGVGVQMMQAIQAGGAIAIARVSWNEPPMIMRVLDAGVHGVVVPMINNGDEAAAAVAAVRFPPRGGRSYGPVRAREVLGTIDPEQLEDVACIVMIETAEGIENAAKIIGTDGVSAVYVGPSDFALALGIPPNRFPHNDEVVGHLKSIVQLCRDMHVCPGIQAANGEVAAFYATLGFQMITIGSDAPFLTSSVRSHLAAARGEGDAQQLPTPASNY